MTKQPQTIGIPEGNRYVTRSICLNATLEKMEKTKEVIDSIRLYRYVANKVFSSIITVEMLGASVESDESYFRIIPNSERAKELLALVFNKTGKAAFYEVREYVLKHLAPTWHSFVFGGMRRELWSRWQARDSVHRASHGYLVLNGVRKPSAFKNVGIGFPSASEKITLDNHTIVLKWDHEIGPITFKIRKLESGQYYVWRMLRAGAWIIRNVLLNERSGALTITFNYHQPIGKVLQDASRITEVSIKGATIAVSGPNDEGDSENIETHAAVSWLSRLKMISADRSKCLSSNCVNASAIGNKRVFLALSKKLHNVTERRSKGSKSWNHVWTKRIVFLASRWNSGRIVFEVPEKSELGFHPWSWSEFFEQLHYKAEAVGIEATKKAYVKTDVITPNGISGDPDALNRIRSGR